MSSAWRERPTEERYALNPALAALILSQASIGYRQETRSGMPYLLSYLVKPMILDSQTRSSLPESTRTSLASWLVANPILRAAIHLRVGPYGSVVREGLVVGLRTGLITLEGATLETTSGRADGPRLDLPELRELLRTAHLLGRLIAKVGSPATVFALVGVRP